LRTGRIQLIALCAAIFAISAVAQPQLSFVSAEVGLKPTYEKALDGERSAEERRFLKLCSRNRSPLKVAAAEIEIER